MAPLLELDDPAHENAAKTASNARTPLFETLPLEIRISIYEHALTEDNPISPYQVAQRSNKFLWETQTIVRNITHQYQPPKFRKVFVSDFARTCRQIYFELRAFPVFYRVNRFDFSSIDIIIKFLSAITPQRRAFIRNITLRMKYHEISPRFPSSRHDNEVAIPIQSVAVLLCQCTELRDLELILPFWRDLHTHYPPHIYNLDHILKDDAKGILRKCIELSTSQPPKHAIWNLPYIRPVLCGYLMSPNLRVDCAAETRLDLTDPQPLQLANPKWLSDQDFRDMVREAKKAVGSLRKRLAVAEAKSDGYRAGITATQLEKAIYVSEIDFPGEDRIFRDRFNSTTGTISTRTRQKCSKDKVNDLGILERSTSKYNAEGILTWSYIKFHGVRWNGPVIECDVENPHDDDGKGGRSWENLEAVLTTQGRWSLCEHYKGLAKVTAWADPVRDLQKIREMPSPKNITDVVDPLLRDLRAETPRFFNHWARDWKETQQKHEEMLERLEHAVEAANAVEASDKKRKAGRTTTDCTSRGRAAKPFK